MNTDALIAALLTARHTPPLTETMIRAALTVDDSEEFVTELVQGLMNVIHTVSHNSELVDTLLDLFAAFPDALSSPASNLGMIRASDAATAQDLDAVFQDMTAGTNKADRLWSYRPMLGPMPMHAVVLEGSGFKPRYLAVMDGTADDARSLRDALAARDGH